MRWHVIASLLVLVAAGAVGDAHADVLGGDLGRCPRGAIVAGYTHGGVRCAPAPTCVRDRDCSSGSICEWAALCIDHGTVSGVCASGDHCAAGTCERARRCARR